MKIQVPLTQSEINKRFNKNKNIINEIYHDYIQEQSNLNIDPNKDMFNIISNSIVTNCSQYKCYKNNTMCLYNYLKSIDITLTDEYLKYHPPYKLKSIKEEYKPSSLKPLNELILENKEKEIIRKKLKLYKFAAA